ncbi:GNAT family N-acetyltransferase [Thalassobellus sediminis]|uniref:GNAT family N-acetyltransferase n=1 Tax=Thalassobellus sediminis TaxID=3367753 RepID=UPI00379B649F
MKTHHIYNSYKELPESWKHITEHDVFLQPNYFEALEEASPKNIQFFYVGVFNNDLLVGVAVVQRVQLYLNDMFRKTEVSCFREAFKSIVSKIVRGNILVVGNLMHTGQHGVFYQANSISQAEYLDVVFEALNTLRIRIKTNQKKTIRAIMLKDFFEADAIHKSKAFFLSNKLHHVYVQPNMTMRVNPNWLKMEDYLASLNKKYKNRYKRAKKKLGKITCKELDLKTIETHSETLHQLYLNVSNNAKFNTFELAQNHFYNLKLQLKASFKVFGYYLDDQLIGFYTLILNGDDLETYFLGYDTVHQYPNQLYLNMLYDMVKFAIEDKFSNIVYARTAMEIKSSVGAKPEPMSVYIKHTNGFINAILKQIFKLMHPKQDWEERHPFKI